MTQELTPEQEATVERFGIFDGDGVAGYASNRPATGPMAANGAGRASGDICEDLSQRGGDLSHTSSAALGLGGEPQ